MTRPRAPQSRLGPILDDPRRPDQEERSGRVGQERRAGAEFGCGASFFHLSARSPSCSRCAGRSGRETRRRRCSRGKSSSSLRENRSPVRVQVLVTSRSSESDQLGAASRRARASVGQSSREGGRLRMRGARKARIVAIHTASRVKEVSSSHVPSSSTVRTGKTRKRFLAAQPRQVDGGRPDWRSRQHDRRDHAASAASTFSLIPPPVVETRTQAGADLAGNREFLLEHCEP
jgi:hypothetical protein